MWFQNRLVCSFMSRCLQFATATWTLGCAFTHVPSCRICSYLPNTFKFYWHTEYCPSCYSQISATPNRRISFFFTWLVKEILDEQIPEPEGRSNPRVVKKTRAKFPSKKPLHRGQTAKLETLTFSILNTA